MFPQPPPTGSRPDRTRARGAGAAGAGLTNPAMANRLVVSRATIKAHVSSILTKLGASTRAEAVRLALQHQLVPD